MLRSLIYPAMSYDLLGLSFQGIVSVGRETDSAIRLDSQDVPFLLSRKHCHVQFQSDGRILLSDMNSTNGTYAARRGQPLRKVCPSAPWTLQEGDMVGFGGPETIVARRQHVPNPFVFRFYPPQEVPAAAPAAVQSESAPLRLQDEQQDTLQDQDPPAGRMSRSLSAEAQVAPPAELDLIRRQKTMRHAAGPSVVPSRGGVATRSSVHARQAAEAVQPAPGLSPCTKMKEVLSAHLSCAICQDWLVACHALPCGHMYCGICLATWLGRKQSCPTCRQPVSGVPVRCFQVDNTINDLLDKGVQVMSPMTTNERRQKQQHWDDVQGMVVTDWSATLQERRRLAAEAAARHHQEFMTAPESVPAIGGAPLYRMSEHGVEILERP